ncbi:hypothetical protein BJV77DRAFT_963480 [Russula vinacea]|nr:hypothetical protein BJV77DRAFT_963480 [Russula vinacea]
MGGALSKTSMGVHMSVMVNICAQATVPAFRKVFMRSVGVFKEWAVYLTVVEAQSKQFHLRGLDMADETPIPCGRGREIEVSIMVTILDMASSSVNRSGSSLSRGHMFGGLTQPETPKTCQTSCGAGGGAERASSSSGASDKLWGLYVDLAQGQDKDKTLNWIGDSEGILVFTGVFSGTVASFLLSSYGNLFPDEMKDNHDPCADFPLTSALLATLMQQWTRRYNQVSAVHMIYERKRSSARTLIWYQGTLHAFTVALLPAIVHASVVLFFMGFAIFLFMANRTVSYPLIATLLLCTIGPYQTPLTSPLWIFLQAARLFLAWLVGPVESSSERKFTLFNGMQFILETGAKVTFDDNERQPNRRIVDAVPSVLLSDNKINSKMTRFLGPSLNEAVWRLLETCKGDILSEGARKQRLTACYRTIWCLEDLSLGHTKDLLVKWMSSRRDSVKEEWDVLCFEAWKVAQQRTKIQSNILLALLAECSQALLAMLWATGRYSTTQDELDEARHILQDQLGCRRPLRYSSHFSDAAKSFGEKALGIPEEDAYQNMMQSEFPEWRNQFITLSSSLRLSNDQKSAFPYITFSDIHELYQIWPQQCRWPAFYRRLISSFQFPCLRAVGVWCCVKLTLRAKKWGRIIKAIQSPDRCWELAGIMRRTKTESGAKPLITPLLPSGSRPETNEAPFEVSERYINNAERDIMTDNPNFLLVAANKLLDDLINEQCIAELKDTNVADDFEKTLHHVLGRYLSSADPQLDPTLENQVTTEAVPTGPERVNLENTLRRGKGSSQRRRGKDVMSRVNGIKAAGLLGIL